MRHALVMAAMMLMGCTTSGLDVTPGNMGIVVPYDILKQTARKSPVSVKVTQVVVAHWSVDRAGLVNLGHERAREAGLTSGDEPIHIAFYVLEHPTKGRFLIDSGVAASFRSPETAPVSGFIASQARLDRLKVVIDTASWIAKHGEIQGVFLTHAHLDHIMGLPDVPSHVPVYMGPGETSGRSMTNMVLQGTTDDLLGRNRPLRSWPFSRKGGVLDIFGDGSAYAIHTPGHTPGSVSFLLHSTKGPRLIVGDASHTDWGWRHCVEPGNFSSNVPESALSLRLLRSLAQSLPDLVVYLGHQHHDHEAPSQKCAKP